MQLPTVLYEQYICSGRSGVAEHACKIFLGRSLFVPAVANASTWGKGPVKAWEHMNLKLAFACEVKFHCKGEKFKLLRKLEE